MDRSEIHVPGTCNWKKFFSKNDSKCLAIIVKLAVKNYQYKERI